MNTNTKEKELLTLQIFSSTIFIIDISVSIILTYNNVLTVSKKRPLLNQKHENSISIINRLVITIVAITFTYISYNFYQINKQKGNDNISRKELIASVLALISAFILLETTIENIKSKSGDNDINIPII